MDMKTEKEMHTQFVNEPESKLLVSPLISLMVVPYIIPYITPVSGV